MRVSAVPILLEAADLRNAHGLARADVVVTSGGLGPTADDLTRESVAAVIGRPLREDPALVALLIERFAKRKQVMPEINKRQALVPEGAIVLPNPRGSAPGLIDTIAGRHAYQIDTLGSSKGFIDSGKLRVLGVAASKRLKQLPDVPTVEEVTGFKFSIDTWYVAQAPAATPRPIVEKLNAAFNKALALPEVTKRMAELAIEPIQSTPEQATKYFTDQMTFWEPIVKESGAKPE